MRLMFGGRGWGLTNNRGPRLQMPRGCRCEVRALKDSRLRASVLMTDLEVVIGSCNFTTASQSNTERGVLLHELAEETLLAQKAWFEQLFEAAIPFKDGLGEVVPPSPER